MTSLSKAGGNSALTVAEPPPEDLLTLTAQVELELSTIASVSADPGFSSSTRVSSSENNWLLMLELFGVDDLASREIDSASAMSASSLAGSLTFNWPLARR